MKFLDQIGKAVDILEVSMGDYSPGGLAYKIRQFVKEKKIKLVVLDSLTGYLNTMPDQCMLYTRLHELVGYLSNAGVLTLMIVTTHGLVGNLESDIDTSYLADAVILMRHFEAMGKVRKCVAVIKKRYGQHENTIRELRFDSKGIEFGSPLEEFSGLLSGTPRFEGKIKDLIKNK